jgi:hypothetical protein
MVCVKAARFPQINVDRAMSAISLPVVAVEAWYEVGKTAYPNFDASYSFDQWRAS